MLVFFLAIEDHFLAFSVNLLSLLLLTPLIKINKYKRLHATGHSASCQAAHPSAGTQLWLKKDRQGHLLITAN